MVAKRKTFAGKTKGGTKVASSSSKPIFKKGAGLSKIRLGILVGKDFDPVEKNSQPPNFPSNLVLTEDDWGKYSIDACTALRMKDLHPDLLEIDIIPGTKISQKRLQQNTLNLSFWPELCTAYMEGNKKRITEYEKCWSNPDCRLDPSGDYYDWVVAKPRYMQQCKKAGIPMIDTVVYKNGFDPRQCMKDVKKKGWDKFFVKVGQFGFFGMGAINGKTDDFLVKRASDLEKYAQDNKNAKSFLLQPYMLKPNGEVFDEVRNFFIDGQWRYSVFTHGTDGSDAGYYQEPDGPRKVACKAMAERVYQEVLKASTWEGKRQTPLLNRIDIGVIPKKGGCSLHKTDNQYFMNEVELICTTWLDRYAPCNVSDLMAHAAVKHSLELLVGMLNAKRRVPDEANVKKVVALLNNRLGPFRNLKLKK